MQQEASERDTAQKLFYQLHNSTGSCFFSNDSSLADGTTSSHLSPENKHLNLLLSAYGGYAEKIRTKVFLKGDGSCSICGDGYQVGYSYAPTGEQILGKHMNLTKTVLRRKGCHGIDKIYHFSAF